MSAVDRVRDRSVEIGGVLVAIVLAVSVAWLVFGVPVAEHASDAIEAFGQIVTVGYVSRSIEWAAPVTLAAVGGLYAEKSGVFNIGLEGFMIFGAFTAAAGAIYVGGETAFHAWVGIGFAVVVTTILTVLFAVLLIEFEADQIVAGLGIWFIALGLAPFGAIVLWGSQRSPSVPGIDAVHVPVLSEIPYLGRIVFQQTPLVWLTLFVVLATWILLYRTKYGYWIQAAGENPEALDTAGIDVNRVRYATVIVSGALAGLGGAVLLAHSSSFLGTGTTMVDGRGWLGIVAYLFGNYNPLGAAAAALLFGGVDMLQGQLQTFGIEMSTRLLELLPYVAVIVVLAGWGRTRVPSAVGEAYDTEE